jgi:hypothetical protein
MKTAKKYAPVNDISARIAPRPRKKSEPIVAVLDDSQNRIDLSDPLTDRRTPEEHNRNIREAMEAATVAAGPFIKFRIAEHIEDQEARFNAFMEIAPTLPPTLHERALKLARKFTSERFRSRAIIALGPQLSPELYGRATAIAESMRSLNLRKSTLDGLAPFQPRRKPSKSARSSDD